MTPQEKAALQANAAIGTSGSTATGGTPDFATALSKKYNVAPLTPPKPAAPAFDIGAMFGGAAKTVGDVAGAVGQSIGDVYGNIGNVAQAANPFSGEDFGQRAGRLGQTAMNMANPVIQNTQELAGNVVKGVGDIANAISPYGDLDVSKRMGQAAGGLGRLMQAPTDFVAGAAPGLAQLKQGTGVRGADMSAQYGQSLGENAGKGIVNTAGALGNIAQGAIGVAQGEKTAYDKLLRQGLFQGVSGVAGTAFSPFTAGAQFIPKPAQEVMGMGYKAIEDARNDAYRSVGLDPNSLEAQNLNAGLQALMDLGSLGAGKVALSAAKAGKLGSLPRQAITGAEMFAGKAANTFNNAVGKAFAGVKKATGKAGDFALNTTSNALWTTPAATMKKIYENGDDFLRAVDDPLAAQASALSRLQGSIDDAVTRSQVGGKGYEALRKSTQKATLPVDGILSKVDDFGLEFVNGKLRPKGGDIMNSRLTADDIAYLNKNVLPELPVGKELTPAQYLNQRKKLDALAKYDMGIPARNDAVRSFVSDMRMTLNDSARNMFAGLAKLDDVASKNIKGLKELRAEFMRKDPVTKQYVLKRDIQPETIANLLSPRNKPRLAVLEKNAPGITRQLEILDLVKQVDRAANITTGAGLKRVGSSMAGGGLAGPVGALAGYLVSDPMMVAKMFARMGAKLGTKQSQVKGGVTAAGETVKGAKETVKSAASTAKGKGKLSTLTQESLNAMGQNIQPQPPTQ